MEMWQKMRGGNVAKITGVENAKKSAGVKNAGKENVRKEIKISSYVM